MIADGNRTLHATAIKRPAYGHDEGGYLQIACRFSPAVFDELREKAKAQDVSMAEIIRRMVERGLWQ